MNHWNLYNIYLKAYWQKLFLSTFVHFQMIYIFYTKIFILYILYHNCWHFLFLNTLYFRAILGSQQNWVEGTEISHISLYPPSTDSPTINIPYQSGTFIIIDDTTLTDYYPPNSMVYTRVHSCVHSVGLNKCVMACIHHYSIVQSSFTGLTSSVFCYLHFHDNC